MLDAYRLAISNVELWGPTNAAPIINHVARFAEKADPHAQVSRDSTICNALHNLRDLHGPLSVPCP